MKPTAYRLSLIAGLLFLAGCTSVPYHCPLSEHRVGSDCAPMQDIYDAAKADKGLKHARPVENVYDTPPAQRALRDRNAGLQGMEQGAPALGSTATLQAPVTGMPVWQQPSVHRAWVRPHTDANGNLFGGGYVYYTTPGGWGAGSLGSEKPGGALFGPAPVGNASNSPQAQGTSAPSAPLVGGQGGPSMDGTGRPPLPPSTNTSGMGPAAAGSEAPVMNLKQ